MAALPASIAREPLHVKPGSIFLVVHEYFTEVFIGKVDVEGPTPP